MIAEERANFNQHLEESALDTEMELADNIVTESKTEKFNRVKRTIYDKCATGSITVTEREALIQRAHDVIFEADQETEQPAVDQKQVSQDLQKAQKDQQQLEKQAEQNAKDMEKSLKDNTQK